MAKLGTVQAKWRRDYTSEAGRECYTEYALRADGTVCKKQGEKALNEYTMKHEWHDWGWNVVKLKGVKFRSTPQELADMLGPKGYYRR